MIDYNNSFIKQVYFEFRLHKRGEEKDEKNIAVCLYSASVYATWAWLCQLKYIWAEDIETRIAEQTISEPEIRSATFPYGTNEATSNISSAFITV